jgi:hypothetical protein
MMLDVVRVANGDVKAVSDAPIGTERERRRSEGDEQYRGAEDSGEVFLTERDTQRSDQPTDISKAESIAGRVRPD